MPNKTIYIRDSDAEVWDRAQKKLDGESISSIITDCLKERLKASKTVDKVDAMKNVIAEVNQEKNLSVELHPFWSGVILDANTLDLGYKLHQKRAHPDRIMSLIVDPLSFDTDGSFFLAARGQIKTAIMEFWDERRSDRHTVVRVGDIDILSRLRGLVGKHGLVNIAQAGEVGFKFLSVHPAPDLPTSGDDSDLQGAIAQSDFTVQFDKGILVEGSNRRVISGLHISLIMGRY
jgi:hypothetical protein